MAILDKLTTLLRYVSISHNMQVSSSADVNQKCGTIGFSNALALEGRKSNIFVNTIAPNAGTQLTRTVLPEELVQAFKPEYVVPLVLLLCSDKVPDPPTGRLFEVGSGWQGQTRWQRTGGYGFPVDTKITPEAVREKWAQIIDFDDGRRDNPFTIDEGSKGVFTNLQKQSQKAKKGEKNWLAEIEKYKNMKSPDSEFRWTDRDVLLYNLSLNARRTQLPLVYENDPDFQVLPTYGVIPPFFAKDAYTFADLVPNFSMTRILHGEQYLEIRKFPIPTDVSTITNRRLLEVVDKGNAALVVQGCETKDAKTGEVLFYNQSTIFVRGSGGFGGVRNDINRGPSSINVSFPNMDGEPAWPAVA